MLKTDHFVIDELTSGEKGTFSSQQKAGLQHAVNRRFLGKCQMVRTCIIYCEIMLHADKCKVMWRI